MPDDSPRPFDWTAHLAEKIAEAGLASTEEARRVITRAARQDGEARQTLGRWLTDLASRLP